MNDNKQLMFRIQEILHLVLFIVFTLSFIQIGRTQTSINKCPIFEIQPSSSSFIIQKEKLAEVKTLKDINPYYNSSWVKTYFSVKVEAYIDNEINVVYGKSDSLNQDQLNLLLESDVGKEISISIEYLPKNNLEFNEVKIERFSFLFYPEENASYIEGDESLENYIQNLLTECGVSNHLDEEDLVILKFSIDLTGIIKNVHVIWPSKDVQFDNYLLTIIREMPSWSPARYSNGVAVDQEFSFSLGNHESCAINMLGVIYK